MILNVPANEVVQLPSYPQGITLTVTNMSGGSVYYGDQNVGPTRNAGVITPGSTVTIDGRGYYLYSPTGCQINAETNVEGSKPWTEELVRFGGGGGGGAVSQILSGSGISISPGSGVGPVTVSNAGVTQLLAGSNVTVSGGGTGVVTIGATGGGGGGAATSYSMMANGGVGDGVTDETAAAQALFAVANAKYVSTGARQRVIFDPGHAWLIGQLTLPNGVEMVCDNAAMLPNLSTWHSGGLITSAASAVLKDAGITGGNWIGTGTEVSSQRLFRSPNVGAMKDVTFKNMTIKGWGTVPLAYMRNPYRVYILNNTLENSEINNTGLDNSIDFVIDNAALLAPDPCGWAIVMGNMVTAARADSIACVFQDPLYTGPFMFLCTNNICSGQPPRFDAGCTLPAAGGTTILDPSIQAGDVNKSCWANGVGFGGTITNPPFVQSVTPGVSFVCSQAMASGSGTTATVQIGGDVVNTGAISFESDNPEPNLQGTFIIANNIVNGYGTRGCILAGTPSNTTTFRGKIHDNTCVNTIGAGIDINTIGNNRFYEMVIHDNRLTSGPGVPEITGGSTSTPILHSYIGGTQAYNNRYSTHFRKGVATLVTGTVVVPTAELRQNDLINLSVINPSGTRGMVEVGARIAGTLTATLIWGTLKATLTSGAGTAAGSVPVAANGIAVPANGTVLSVSGTGIASGTTIVIDSPTTAHLSANATANTTLSTITCGLISPVAISAGSIAVPAVSTILGVDGQSVNTVAGTSFPAFSPGTTLTITSSTTGTLSSGAIAPTSAALVNVGNFVINSVQPGTASTLQAGDGSGVFWEIMH